MFKLKYNILVIVQILLNLLNATLLINIFGVTAKADAYLISTSIFLSLQFIQGMSIEQFTQFYNDVKVKNIEDSHVFYNSALIFTIFIGALSLVLFTLGTNMIINIFAQNIDSERFTYLLKLLKILFIGSAVMPIICLNERLFIAEMRISISYILQIIQILFVVIMQVFLLLTHSTNIELLAWALSMGRIVATCLSLYIAFKIIPFKFTLWHKTLIPFIKNSLIIKIGDNIPNFILPIIINNILSSLGTSVASCYYYALKIVEILNNISIGPQSKILKSEISKYISNCQYAEIIKSSKNFIIKMSIVFIIAGIATYFIQEPILKFISANKLTQENLTQIALIFLVLAIYYYFKLVEYPYLTTCITAKKGRIIILSNLIFLLMFSILVYFLIKIIGIFAIPVGMCFAEIFPFIIYLRSSKFLLYNESCN